MCSSDLRDQQQLLFLGPAGGSMKLPLATGAVQVVSLEAPLGRALLGKGEGDEVALPGSPVQPPLEVLWVQ